MNRRWRVVSTPRRWRLRRRAEATGVRRRTSRWPRTADEVEKVYAAAIDRIRKWINEKQATFPPGSPNHAFLERLHGLPPDKLFEEILKGSYPNPERVGCPPYRVLMELGTRRRGLDDPWLEHIAHCYPCHMELRPLVRAYMPPDTVIDGSSGRCGRNTDDGASSTQIPRGVLLTLLLPHGFTARRLRGGDQGSGTVSRAVPFGIRANCGYHADTLAPRSAVDPT
jgi:hypothetical protein